LLIMSISYIDPTSEEREFQKYELQYKESLKFN